MAASDPTPYVATPTGALQGVAAFSWDGSAWQPSGRAGPDVATPTGVLQGVAAFNGGPAWQPAGLAQPGVATPTGVLDGVAVYTWSGSAWTPTGGTATTATPSGALRGVAAFNWDGSAWQPAAQARASVPTPYGVLDGVAMFNWSGTAWAAVGAPSLDLSFMTPGTLDPRITFTRASTATYFDVTGTLQIAATNTPRWDYDPATHVLNGMLVEEARTNLLLNSATLGTQSVAVTAQNYALSFYGTGTVTKSGAASGALVGTGAAQRVSQIFTPSAGTLTLTVTGTVTNAQLEAGGIGTSYIPTAGATATRAVEVCAMPTTGWLSLTASSFMAELMVWNVAQQSRIVGAITDGTTNNRLSLYALLSGTGIALFSATITGATTSSASLGLVVTNVPAKMAAAWDGTTGRGSLNAGAVVSVGVGLPAALNTLTVGNLLVGSAFVLNGWVRRIAYWPRALSNAELQQVTT